MSDSATTFWLELRTVKDGNNHPKFSLLSKFMCCLLALPHSSACVERIFSQLNIIKTKKTNRLHVSTVANRLLARQGIARKAGACHKWEPSTSIEDVKSGQCHRRYNEREAARQQGEVALCTLMIQKHQRKTHFVSLYNNSSKSRSVLHYITSSI